MRGKQWRGLWEISLHQRTQSSPTSTATVATTATSLTPIDSQASDGTMVAKTHCLVESSQPTNGVGHYYIPVSQMEKWRHGKHAIFIRLTACKWCSYDNPGLCDHRGHRHNHRLRFPSAAQFHLRTFTQVPSISSRSSLGLCCFPPSLTDTQLATADRKRDLLIKGFKIVLTYSIETIQD